MATIDLIPPNANNAVTLYGTASELRSISPDMFGFGFTENADWYRTSDSKTDIDERVSADGGFDIDRDWRTSLAVSVSGWYRGKTRSDVRAARNQLALAVAQGRMIVMRFTDEDESTERTLSVRSVTPDDDRGALFFRFAIDAVAPDQKRYSQADDFGPVTGPVSGGGLFFPLGTSPAYWDFGQDGSSGRVEITNYGTADAFPFISVTGGLSGGFIVTDVTTGKQVIFNNLIPDGSIITINQRTGQVLIDGQSDQSGYITSWDFFSIGPGETHIIQFSPVGTSTGAPSATFTFQSAYL